MCQQPWQEHVWWSLRRSGPSQATSHVRNHDLGKVTTVDPIYILHTHYACLLDAA